MSFFSKLAKIFSDDEPKQELKTNAFFNHKATSETESEDESDDENSSNQNQSDDDEKSDIEQESEQDSEEKDDNEEKETDPQIKVKEKQEIQNEIQYSDSENENSSIQSSESCESCKIKKQKKQIVSEHEESDKEKELWYWSQKQQQEQKQQIQQEKNDFALQCLLQGQELISLHHQHNYVEVLEQLYDPQIQLDYINFIWDDIQEHKIYIMHIELLCKHSPEQVASFLRSGKYPIFDSLFFTKAYNIYEGTAVLLEMLNKIDECITMYLVMLDEILRKFLREQLRLPVQISKKQKSYLTITSLQQLIVIFQKFLGNIKLVLEKNRDDQNVDILYFQLFNKIIDWQQMLNQVFYLNKTKIEVLSIINFFRLQTPDILIKLLYSTEIELFMDELINNYSKLRLGVQFYGFRQAFLDFQCFINILKISNREIISNNNRITKRLEFLRNSGFQVENICSRCSKQLIAEENEKVFVMSCCHAYHLACLAEKKCFSCSLHIIEELQNITIRNNKQILKLKSAPDLQNYKVEPIKQQKQIHHTGAILQQTKREIQIEKWKLYEKQKFNKQNDFF